MMINLKSISPVILFLFFSIIWSSCKSRPDESSVRTEISDEQLVEINRELVIKERERIESFIERKGFDMNMSETGIWYKINREGSGQRLTVGDRVKLEYDCSLLDGTLCYSSESDGLLDVNIGNSNIPSGLDEALRLLNIGAEAVIILPSALAYGLIGDGVRIPSRAALLYNIKVVEN